MQQGRIQVKKVFISYKHTDRSYVNQLTSVVSNQNNSLKFDDHSLAEAVLNVHGHVNRRPPSDPLSQPVKDEIEKRLKQSDKLVVIIGNDTHSSEWVKWEMDTFTKYRGQQNLMMMRHQESHGGAPAGYSRSDIKNWNTSAVNNWLK